MDMSSRNTCALEFILGEKHFNQSEFTSDDWLKIIGKVMGIIKPRLKYLSGFKKLRDYGNIEGRIVVKIDFDHASSDGLVSRNRGNMRCSHVCGCQPFDADLRHKASKVEYHDHQLMINVSGDWFVWFVTYVSGPATGNRRPCYLANYIDVIPVRLDELDMEVMEEGTITHDEDVQHMCLGAKIFDGLWGIVARTVKDRRERLDEMREAESEIVSMAECIDSLAPR